MKDPRRRFFANLNALLDLVSDRVCPVCEARRGRAGPLLCRQCARELLRQRLVAPLLPAAFDRWAEEEKAGRLTGIWAAANYRSLVRQCILDFKFRARFAVLPILTSLFCQRFRSLKHEYTPDVIVPVPTTLLRFLYRTTNLPQALARSLGARMQIPWSGALRRAPFGPRQARKSKKDRLKLRHDIFSVWWPRSVRDRRVLLVDDVLTTGGTARACARTLLHAGARSVGILALAHG